MLLGREAECEAIGEVVDAARSGRGGTLVLRGDAGVGKSELLTYARERAVGMAVLEAAGIESDAELPYAALHQLLRSLLFRIEGLPSAQADAVSAALGLAFERPSDRFLVGVGVLGLLSAAAAEQPVLCLVDDAHWLDRESADALLFAARRLEADAVAVLLATRDSSDAGADLATLWVGPLDDDNARALLATRAPAVDDAARERILAAAAGNPLALIELADRSDKASTQAWPGFTSVERAYLDVIRELPSSTQLLLLCAAAAESGEFAWITRAAAALGVDGSALEPAERSALVAVSADGLRFRHPLVRSAVYNSAPFHERRRVHEALAAALRPDESDRRAWHRAAAVVGPDDDVAADLEATASRARRRSGEAAASAALERAAWLSTDDQARLRRLVGAAEAAWQAGDASRADRLLGEARAPDDPALRSDHARLRGLISAQAGRPREAAATLAEAAVALARTVPGRSLELAAIAAEAAWFGGDGVRLASLVDLVRSLPAEEAGESRFAHVYVEGLAAMFDPDVLQAVEPLSMAADLASSLEDARMISWGGDCADLLGDAVRAYELHAKAVARARAVPAIGDLVYGLYVLARSELSIGRVADATADATQALQLAREMDEPGSAAHLTALVARAAAVRGDADACRALAGDALEQAVPAGLPLATCEATLALTEIELVLGDPADALARVEPLVGANAHPAYRIKAVPLLVEAAARADQPERAAPALAAASAWARQTRGPTLLPQLARCCALIEGQTATEETYIEALRLHDVCPVPLDRARTQLAYGEYLRRRKRKADARVQLRAAFETLQALGAGLWAERAAAELRATGETARRRDASTLAELTPQEQQIARLVATGATNRDVAAQLFLSPKTVEYHLRKVFQKLGVASRADLIRLRPDERTAEN